MYYAIIRLAIIDSRLIENGKDLKKIPGARRYTRLISAAFLL